MHCACCAVLYCTALHCTALYCTVLYCIVPYCTALHCTALYCTALCVTVYYFFSTTTFLQINLFIFYFFQSPKFLKFVDPVRSISMLCVRDRISLKTEMKDIWYKDEGGKVNTKTEKSIL